MLKDLHHEVGNEPYKLPTRLLALSNEIGATPAFNCKSGKDRTGQLHVEIRDLYAHLNATGGLLREINAKRQGIAQENFQKLFLRVVIVKYRHSILVWLAANPNCPTTTN